MQRALLGEVHSQLRQASGECDTSAHLVMLRFEYETETTDVVRDSCSCVATEVIAGFPSDWGLKEEHLVVLAPGRLRPLAHIAYLRAEPENDD